MAVDVTLWHLGHGDVEPWSWATAATERYTLEAATKEPYTLDLDSCGLFLEAKDEEGKSGIWDSVG